MIKYRAEIARKTIHLSSLWIPFAYLYLSKSIMLQILIPLSLLALSIDLSRRIFPKINRLVARFFNEIMRSEEKELASLSGATYMLISASITIAAFNQESAILALTILMVSDSLAALVGRRFGKVRIVGKSLEGSLSFAISAVMIYYFFIQVYGFHLPQEKTFLAIIVGTLVELFAKKVFLDDNLAIPLSIGLILSL